MNTKEKYSFLYLVVGRLLGEYHTSDWIDSPPPLTKEYLKKELMDLAPDDLFCYLLNMVSEGPINFVILCEVLGNFQSITPLVAQATELYNPNLAVIIIEKCEPEFNNYLVGSLNVFFRQYLSIPKDFVQYVLPNDGYKEKTILVFSKEFFGTPPWRVVAVAPVVLTKGNDYFIKNLIITYMPPSTHFSKIV
jgi:hypothetical protein